MFGFNKCDIRLMINFFKMNIRDRYLGSSLGCFWAITNPLFMLVIYTYVFGFVFKTKLPGSETTLSYVIWLICGYGPWIALNESIMGAANSVIGASGLIKNMTFKTELLPISGALVGLISLSVSLCFLIILLIANGNGISWMLVFLPIVVFVQFAFVAAIGIWLAAIAVFVRDIIQILPTVLTAIMFMTPIFYSFESMPRIIQYVSHVSPLYLISKGYRVIIIENRMPDMLGLGYVAMLSFVIFYFGLGAFRRAKGSFDSAI